jgi:hypothetical protein
MQHLDYGMTVMFLGFFVALLTIAAIVMPSYLYFRAWQGIFSINWFQEGRKWHVLLRCSALVIFLAAFVMTQAWLVGVLAYWLYGTHTLHTNGRVNSFTIDNTATAGMAVLVAGIAMVYDIILACSAYNRRFKVLKQNVRWDKQKTLMEVDV